MDRDSVLSVIKSNGQDIRERYDLKHLSVFGSIARGDSGSNSDVDVLVEFNGSATYDAIMGLADYLEELVGRHVDLVTKKSLSSRLLRNIESEAILIA